MEWADEEYPRGEASDFVGSALCCDDGVCDGEAG